MLILSSHLLLGHPSGKQRGYTSVNLILYIFRAIVLYTQVFLQLIAQVVVLLLHVSAESHNNLQGVQYGVLTYGLYIAYLTWDL
jgi:hypothetical protein